MLSIRKLGAIGRTYRHLNRYHQILRVLFKYGFNDLVDRLHIDRYLESGLKVISRKPKEQISRLSRPERLRLVLEELGPTFIKLGQLLSIRPDLIPAEYLDELAKLQDKVPPFAYEEVCEIITGEFGAPPDDFFSFFDKEPLAAASIGQVHRARLDNGSEVVVKVQRPRLENTIAVDLEILAHLASLMEQYLEEVHDHRPTEIVQEFSRSLSREIDFSIELASIERFDRQFEGNSSIYVPKVFPRLSTERVLVMEYIQGIKCSEIEELTARKYDLSLIAETGAVLVMEQIFIHGFFHSDPHPGNIFIMPGNVVCFIDFGQMGRLSLKDREDFADFVMSLVSGDERKSTKKLLNITYQHGEINQSLLCADLASMMDLYLYRQLGELKADKILQDILSLVSRHRLSLKPGLYVMMKALTTVEGIGLVLDPDIKLINLARPFMGKVQLGRITPRRLTDEFMEAGSSYVTLFRQMPDDLLSILQQLRSGKLKLELEHPGLLAMESALDRVSNIIAFAIVLAALVIGSSLIVLSGVPPLWHNIPIIGLIGFLVAGIMGFWLLVSILRNGRM